MDSFIKMNIIIIINGEEFIKPIRLNDKSKLSETRLLFLENHGIRKFIGYPKHTLIFLHKGSSVDISKEDNKCLSDILSNNNILSIKTKKNNLEEISIKIGQN